MHDTFLNENIYKTVEEVCKDNQIKKVNSMTISVHPNSHVSLESLIEVFSERKSNLVGDWTKIHIEKNEAEQLMAVIKEIDGEGLDGC